MTIYLAFTRPEFNLVQTTEPQLPPLARGFRWEASAADHAVRLEPVSRYGSSVPPEAPAWVLSASRAEPGRGTELVGSIVEAHLPDVLACDGFLWGCLYTCEGIPRARLLTVYALSSLARAAAALDAARREGRIRPLLSRRSAGTSAGWYARQGGLL